LKKPHGWARSGRWDLAAVFDLFPRSPSGAPAGAIIFPAGEQQMLARSRGALMTNPALLCLTNRWRPCPIIVEAQQPPSIEWRPGRHRLDHVEQHADIALSLAHRCDRPGARHNRLQWQLGGTA